MRRFKSVGFELTKSFISWDITQFSPLKVSRRFGGILLYLQGRRISQARNQREAGGKQNKLLLVTCYMLVSCLPYSAMLSQNVG
jgi:hypothetical protein